MPRGKHKAGGQPRGRGNRGRGQGGRYRAGPSGPTHATTQNRGNGLGYTLADEARQTSLHDESFWSKNNKLRSRPVTFVSAGPIEPMEELNKLLQGDETTAEEAGSLKPEKESLHSDANVIQPLSDTGISNDQGHNSSSQEQDLFFFDLVGWKDEKEGSWKLEHDRVDATQAIPQHEPSSDEEVILFKGRDASKRSRRPSADINMRQLQTEIKVVEQQITTENHHQSHVNSLHEVLGSRPVSRRKRGRKGRKIPTNTESDNDELIADYIANLHESGEYEDFMGQKSQNQRDLGGSDGDYIPEASTEDESSLPRDHTRSKALHVKEDMDASSVELHSTSGQEEIPAIEQYNSGSELDDETLARLIAGQEGYEFPPNANSFDGVLDESESSSDEDDSDMPAAGPVDWDEYMNLGQTSSNGKKRKGKAVLGTTMFGVSDPELEQVLETAWKNDRMKKSQRKKQREELRALGMLGKNAKPPDDPMVKYAAGMNLDQVAEELRAFLMNSNETLCLPPMDKHARKVIHQLAQKFNIKSKSTGKGEHRRPALYRTARTLPFVQSTFDRAVSRVHRPYFPRMDVKGKRPPKMTADRTSYAEASYRDGEIVGAAAPELGNDNRGRNMLEKMGWSKGTALGAVHNKGILQPVAQTMKRNKAGLG